MIFNQWYAILESKEVPGNKPVGVTRLNEKLVLWRDAQGELGCIKHHCCHRGAALELGKVVGDHIQCPFHGFEYDKTGKVQKIPAIGEQEKVADWYNVEHYTVREKYDFIWLWWGDEDKMTDEIPFFDDLEHEDFSYKSFKDHWPVHYSRAVENQLDVVHLPFVHHNTIGAGHKTLVNGPVVVVDGNRLTFYVDNEKDHHQKPMLPEEIKNLGDLPYLKMVFPNIWENIISDKVRVMAAFVPVDEENSVVYIRFYQRFITVPVLSELVNLLGILFSIIILRQDKRVVISQRPVKTDVKMDEKLIVGDLPIIEYRNKREALKKEGIKNN
ncbi:MAG: aromatic ring-hydroxylating dioxygenase subunit alpha [Eubacterium sp.]